jgi:dCMP deaminase
MNKWDLRFLELCKFISSWSKDPSTKTGAAIVRPDNTIVSVGYNGFPPNIEDTEERLSNRELKYQMVIHCEMNALILTRESIVGCTLYTYPFISCSRCAAHFIRVGITRVVAPIPPEDKLERWGEDFKLSRSLFKEACIEVEELDIWR